MKRNLFVMVALSVLTLSACTPGLSTPPTPTYTSTPPPLTTSTVSQNQFKLQLLSSPPGSCMFRPDSGVYPAGTNLQVLAIPNPGLRFDSWSGDVQSTNNPITINMDRDYTLQANFGPLPMPTPTPTPTKTTAPPASTALYVPQGQQFTGGIQTQGGGQTSYFVDKAPFCAYGGAPVLGYTWSLAIGSTLPPGTTFDPTTGMFYQGGAGIAIVPGTHTFKMVASDGSKTATGTFSLVVNTGPILPTATFQKSLAANITLPDAKAGLGYGASLWAVGNGALPWKWSVMSGGLPPGLQINPASGVIYGTPLPSTAGKTYEFRISVKDGIGAEAIGEPTYSILVTK